MGDLGHVRASGTSAATREIVLATRPPAPPSAQREDRRGRRGPAGRRRSGPGSGSGSRRPRPQVRSTSACRSGRPGPSPNGAVRGSNGCSSIVVQPAPQARRLGPRVLGGEPVRARHAPSRRSRTTTLARRRSRRGRVRARRPKIQWPASDRRVERRRRRVVAGRPGRPARPASSRPRSGSPNASPGHARALGQAGERPARIAGRRRPRGAGGSDPRLLEHVGADPVGAERDALAERAERRPARRRCSCSSAALWTTVAPAARRATDLLVVEVHAVGEQRALVERAGARQSLHDADAVAGPAIRLVGRVLRDVDVEADPGRSRPASTHAASVSSDRVNEAWAPTMPRASGQRAGGDRAPGTAGSRRRPAAARSGPVAVASTS